MSQGLGTRTARAMVWVYASYVGGRALVFVSMAILARVLTPEDFGLVALALIVTTALETLKDLGLTQALIVADEEETERRAPTIFFLTVGIGFVLWGITAIFAPLAVGVFDEPEVAPLLIALGSNFVLRALGATHYALAAKHLDFRKRTFAEVGDVVVRGFASIGLALAGAGVWSIVIGYLAGTVALTITLWVMVPWRPRLELRFEGLSHMVRFGGSITGIDVMSAINRNVDLVAVGTVLGAAALGLYSLAYRIPELLVLNFAVVGSYVLFPAFATLRREEMRDAYLTSFRYIVAITLPLAIGIFVLASPLMLALFGDQWVGADGAMQALSLFALMIAFDIPAGTVYKATGRADVLFKLAIPRFFVLVALMVLVADQGITTVAYAQVGVGALFLSIQLYLTKRLLGAGFLVLARVAAPAVAATAAMAAALFGLDQAISAPWPTLIVAGVVGGAVYLGVLRLLAPDLVRGIVERLRPGPTAEAEIEAAPAPSGAPSR
jgi:O-antigen/teichoic acid export membrane protein